VLIYCIIDLQRWHMADESSTICRVLNMNALSCFVVLSLGRWMDTQTSIATPLCFLNSFQCIDAMLPARPKEVVQQLDQGSTGTEDVRDLRPFSVLENYNSISQASSCVSIRPGS
jgi:hypothetical protein